MQSVLVAAQQVQIFVGQEVFLDLRHGTARRTLPALEGARPCRSPARPTAARAAGLRARMAVGRGAVPSVRISAYPTGPTAKAMSANPGPTRRRAQPDPAAGGLAPQFERRAGAQRSSTAIGGPIVPRRREARPALPDFDIDKDQLFRHERGFMSMLAPGACLSWLFLFHFRHDRCFAPRPPQDMRAMEGQFHHCSMIRRGF